MRILVFGSANIDRTYYVDHFAAAGETISADGMDVFCGGKGFNQAIALARAGGDVSFAGAVGEDGDLLRETLRKNGVDVRHLERVPGPSGHAVIQVTPEGQNCIMILAGANGSIGPEYADRVLDAFSEGDLVVLQNEISSVGHIIRSARKRGMQVALNPSPFDRRIEGYDLSLVDYLLVNEVEGKLLTGFSEPERIAEEVRRRYPNGNLVLTLGSEGALYAGRNGERFSCGIYSAETVDTTAAGDTYTGFFLSGAAARGDVASAMRLAAVASGISVSRRGASASIPDISEVRAVDPQKVRVKRL